MTDHPQLQVSVEQRTKIAADAESAKQAAYHPHTAMMHLYCDQVLGILADLASLEADNQRLRERAEVAEKAVEWTCRAEANLRVTARGDFDPKENPERLEEMIADDVAEAYREARAALGVAQQSEGR